MNEIGAVLITDLAAGRVWEAEKDLPLTEYTDPDGTRFLAPDEEAVFADMRSSLDPIVRRSPRERLEATLRPIVEAALTAYRLTGKVIWPASAQRVLDELARDDPSLLKGGGAEQVIRQGTALARYIAETGLRQQKEQDRKKVTLDWSGH